MESLTIVRGDLTEKPVASERLAKYFEQHKQKYEGVLYIGYPIIGTSKGSYQIDGILITKSHGLIVISLSEEKEDEIKNKFEIIQDENHEKINSKLLLNSKLTKRRSLGFPINTLTFAPLGNLNSCTGDYNIISELEQFNDYISSLQFDSDYYEPLLSSIQSITSIRGNKSRDYVKKELSRGGKLKKLEDSIANLDRQQSRAVIETVEGVQRIRGLAGSGKTIILALKVAYLHVKNPSWKIAVTFNTRSLKNQFRKLINMFVIEHSNSEPNWKNIDIIHAWGNNKEEGIYYNLTKDHSIKYYDFNEAKAIMPIYGKEFDLTCEKALTEIKTFREKYDLIVIDEAQDFSKHFLLICYNILRNPKRLVYAYDELQSLSKKSMSSPEDIFGNNSQGKPLVNLINEAGKPLKDIILYKCYRNSKEILTTAHAIGFGIYRKAGLVQMFENSKLWADVGYESSEIEEGQEVVLSRTEESSPKFLSIHSEIDDMIQFKQFASNEEQIDYIVKEIIKNLEEDELRFDDIIVINPNPLTTKNVVGAFRSKLFEKGINSNLAGVSNSPDIFYDENTITFTGIYRAKGNEASMVYILNAHDCYEGYELAKKRNILFTAITRSKAWVRICGYGQNMSKLISEYELVKENGFKLKFTYPTAQEREHLNIINRDMTLAERESILSNNRNLSELAQNLKEGRLFKEDLNPELLSLLKDLINEG